MKDNLTICSVVYNDIETKLFDLMVQSVIKFTNPMPQFVICDNGGNELGKYKNQSNFTIISNVESKSKGSLQHGESLNNKLNVIERTSVIAAGNQNIHKGTINITEVL